MANTQANVATVAAIGVSALLGPVGLVVGTTLAILARVKRAELDNYEEERREEVDNNFPVVPQWFNASQLGSQSFFPIVTTNPETELIRSLPRLGANVLKLQELADTHRCIVAPVALEFARQGRTRIRAITTRSLFGGSISTIIEAD